MHHHTYSIIAVFLSVSATALSLPATAAAAAAATADRSGELRQNVADGVNTVGEHARDVFTSTKVTAALIADTTIKARDIAVETMDDVVYLTGTVQTEEQKATAEQIARDVEGVKSVVNHLKLAAD